MDIISTENLHLGYFSFFFLPKISYVLTYGGSMDQEGSSLLGISSQAFELVKGSTLNTLFFSSLREREVIERLIFWLRLYPRSVDSLGYSMIHICAYKNNI